MKKIEDTCYDLLDIDFSYVYIDKDLNGQAVLVLGNLARQKEVNISNELYELLKKEIGK